MTTSVDALTPASRDALMGAAFAPLRGEYVVTARAVTFAALRRRGYARAVWDGTTVYVLTPAGVAARRVALARGTGEWTADRDWLTVPYPLPTAVCHALFTAEPVDGHGHRLRGGVATVVRRNLWRRRLVDAGGWLTHLGERRRRDIVRGAVAAHGAAISAALTPA